MIRTILLPLLVLWSSMIFAQIELINEEIRSIDYTHIIVRNTTGVVEIVESQSACHITARLFLNDTIQYPDDISEYVHVRMKTKGDTLVVQTKFNQDKYQGKNHLWKFIDDIRVHITLQVPKHPDLAIKQKYGSVWVSSLPNPLRVELDHSSLIASYLPQLDIRANGGSINLSSCLKINLNGEYCDVLMHHVKSADVVLKYSSMKLFEVPVLSGTLSQVYANIGRSKVQRIDAERSTIEWTTIDSLADLHLMDVFGVIQKAPPESKIVTVRGSLNIGIRAPVQSRVLLSADQTSIEVSPNHGQFQSLLQLTKSVLVGPNDKISKDHQVNQLGASSHGILIEGTLKRSSLYYSR